MVSKAFYILHMTELQPLSVLAVCWQNQCSTTEAIGHAVLFGSSLVVWFDDVWWFDKEV
jgi:hypothetical protein